MTAEQKEAVLRGVSAVLAWFDPEGTPESRAAWERVRLAFISLPGSTSCRCCDFHRAGHCIEWNQAIPYDHIETGCQRFQVHGAPF
jgi:hypothetical protein